MRARIDTTTAQRAPAMADGMAGGPHDAERPRGTLRAAGGMGMAPGTGGCAVRT